MKTLVLVLLLSSLMIAPILAGGADSRTELNRTAVIENLMRGINSENDGLRTGSAAIIKQVIDNNLVRPSDFSKSLIPLLKMLDNGTSEYERITAALALYSLGDGIGIYRLRGAARFDNSEQVRSVSKNLYYGYHTIHNSTYFLDF
jgi:hypothetical protein